VAQGETQEIPRPEVQVCGGRSARGLLYPICVVFGVPIIWTVLEPNQHQALCCRQWIPCSLLIALITIDSEITFMTISTDITMKIISTRPCSLCVSAITLGMVQLL